MISQRKYNFNLKDRVSASALGYAITFLMLIGLITSGVLFVSAANKQLEINYSIQEHVLFNNYFSLQQGINSSVGGKQLLIHPSGDSSLIYTKQWGSFKAVTVNTFHGSRKITRSALAGVKTSQNLPALYLPDQRQVIKLCGDTKIEGDAFLSERGLDRGYIAGANYKNDKLLYGTQKRSERNLPPLKKDATDFDFETVRQNSKRIDPIYQDSVFSFAEQTTLISELTPLSISNRIEGNIILHSFDSIYISSNAKLENVILISPVIHFQEGFSGSVQAIASRRILCEKNVSLLYPSTLSLIEEDPGMDQHFIQLNENCKVLGGVLLFSKHPDFRKPVGLKVDQAIIGGLVYNTGETELRGKIFGHLYTNKFSLKAGGGDFVNYLLDATISSEKLPKEFVLPDWLVEVETNNPMIISCF